MLIETRTIESALVKAQRENSGIQYFRLKPGFDSKISVDEVKAVYRQVDGEKKAVGYRVLVTGKTGRSSIYGSTIDKSFIVSPAQATKIRKLALVKDGFKGAFWFDEVAEIVSKQYETLIDEDTDYEFPAELKIVGAAVFKSQNEEHPMIPLYMYPGYKLLRKHHRDIMEDDTARLGYWDAVSYASAEGDDRPKHLAPDFKFEVEDHVKDNPSNWVFRFIFEDPTL